MMVSDRYFMTWRNGDPGKALMFHAQLHATAHFILKSKDNCSAPKT